MKSTSRPSDCLPAQFGAQRGVRSIAKESGGFIRPWLYVVQVGKANIQVRTGVQGPFD